MPVIYKWTMPTTVDQARYDVLITRPGYFAVATPNPGDGTQQSGGSGGVSPAAVATAKSEAIAAAATDATTKANNAQSTAISTAAADATSKANSAQSAAVTSATSTAASDATTKANSAQSAAISAAATDATNKANAVAANVTTNTTAIATNTASIATNTTAIAANTTAIAAAVPKTDRRAAMRFPFRRPKIITHVTTMQTGHGWTASNALAANVNDTATYTLGSQSAYITSKTDATAVTLTSGTLALDMSATKTVRLLIQVTGGDNIQGCSLYVTSDAFAANFAYANIQNVVGDPSVRWLKDGEWKWVTVNMTSTSSASGGVTGTPNYAAINALRVRLTSTSGTSATIRVQAVQVIERQAFAAGGIVCFTYDDSYRNQYTVGKPHLDKWGFPATTYVIHSNVTDGDGGNTAWMTTQMVSDLRHNALWEIGLHTDTLTNHARAFAAATNAATSTVYGTNPLSAAELDTDITNELEWLIANNLTDGFLGHCYPQGRYNTTVARQMANRVAYATAMTANSNGCETIPPADPYAIRRYTLDNTSNIATLQAIIDSVALHGGLVVFCCHDIVTTPSISTQFKTADHATLVDYVANKAGVRVMTLGDVMRGLTAQG